MIFLGSDVPLFIIEKTSTWINIAAIVDLDPVIKLHTHIAMQIISPIPLLRKCLHEYAFHKDIGNATTSISPNSLGCPTIEPNLPACGMVEGRFKFRRLSITIVIFVLKK